jgi:hypothetical protein
MNFDRPTDPKPIDAQLAVTRGVRLINGSVFLIMLCGLVSGALLIEPVPILGGALLVLAIPCAWLWWSYYVPQWRAWALQRGADPEELQWLAVKANLVWPKGSIFERTEFHRRER